MSDQLILAIFPDEAAADSAVEQLKEWDRAGERRFGAIGVLVKDESGKIKTHKLGARRTGAGAVLFALAGLLSGGMTLLGGAILGGVVGSFFRKGLGIPKARLAELDSQLDGGKAAVGLLAHPENIASVVGLLETLGGAVEAHEVADQAVEQAVADADMAAESPAAEAAPAAAVAAAPAIDPEQVKLAAEAYIYGYPLVYNLREIAKFPSGPNLVSAEALPYNTFGYPRQLLGPDAHFVTPNNDTLYLVAMCDVRNGPLVLHVPDTAGRYYVLQFVDAWTNNFAYIGRRATGTAEGQYLLASREYQGAVPHGMKTVCAPTGLFAIVGRIAVQGVEDLPAAHALQDQFTLTPLSVLQGGEATGTVAGVPQPDPNVSGDLKWWEAFRVALAAFPPPAVDAPFLALCEKFGLTAAESPYVNPDPALAQVLVAGQQAAQAKIEELIKTASKPVNGWQDTKHLFDYNGDFLEIGTLDDPGWKITDRTVAYVTRAVVARAGLWGNHGYEATYALIYVDADNAPLDSAHHYKLVLTETPPVDAFWSLTMYDVPEFYLVANPIDRYLIGDHTPGLQFGSDGSLTIYMQQDSPGAEKESNWLPAPKSGLFRPVMRMYQPQAAILDGSYVLPAIQRVA